MEGQLQGLSLVEEEEEGLVFDVDQNHEVNANLELCLVGRFLTDKALRVSIMKERMANVWRPGRGVTIRETQPGIFLFQFYHKLDVMRVFNGGPWSFDNHMLVLEQIKPGDIIEAIPLFHVSFWVQIHDLPVGFITLIVGKHLGNFIGTFVEYDENNNLGGWRNYMRIKVRVDVRVPLKKEKRVKKPGGDWTVVRFKYERLGIFCFLCGVVGHTEHFCEKLFELEHDDGHREWSSELRVDTRRNGGGGGSRWLREGGDGWHTNLSAARGSYTDNVGVTGNHNCHQGADNPNQEFPAHDFNAMQNDTRSNGQGEITATHSMYVKDGAALRNSRWDNQGVLNHVGNSNGQGAITAIYSMHQMVDHGTGDHAMVDHGEKRRRCETAPFSEDHEMVNETQKITGVHFLLAGPGSQACQDQ